MWPGQHPGVGDINEAMPGELDQKLDVLAPDDDHAAGSFVAELDDLVDKVRRSLATADMLGSNPRPGPCEPASLLTREKCTRAYKSSRVINRPQY
jgi:hypothetical protein